MANSVFGGACLLDSFVHHVCYSRVAANLGRVNGGCNGCLWLQPAWCRVAGLSAFYIVLVGELFFLQSGCAISSEE
ncbi:MAG TPA: hypothetical protein DEF45_24260 [Rhodopirellula sp.]|nr:hypothetical protein [Rhodopirellula sp.]